MGIIRLNQKKVQNSSQSGRSHQLGDAGEDAQAMHYWYSLLVFPRFSPSVVCFNVSQVTRVFPRLAPIVHPRAWYQFLLALRCHVRDPVALVLDKSSPK